MASEEEMKGFFALKEEYNKVKEDKIDDETAFKRLKTVGHGSDAEPNGTLKILGVAIPHGSSSRRRRRGGGVK